MDKKNDKDTLSGSQDFFNLNSRSEDFDDIAEIVKECELLRVQYGVKIPKDQVLSILKIIFRFEGQFKLECSDPANFMNIAKLEDMMLERKKQFNDIDLGIIAELIQRLENETDIIDQKKRSTEQKA
jgi:hypothetical protein